MKNIIINYIKEKIYYVAIKRKSKIFCIFNFHQITPEFDNRYHAIGTWTQLDYFKKQLNLIKKHFQIISLCDGIGMMEKYKLNGRYAAITFDDGDASLGKYVLPFLEKETIPATFFINSSYIENGKHDWLSIYRFMQNDYKMQEYLTKDIKQNTGKIRDTLDSKLYNK